MAKCDKYESQGVCYLQEIAKLTTVLFLMFLLSTEYSKSIKCYCQCVGYLQKIALVTKVFIII